MCSKIAAVIVTHNSVTCLQHCLDHLVSQEKEISEIVVVDSGSDDTAYLESLKEKFFFRLILIENMGFAAANNVGVSSLSNDIEFVIFVNPDLYLLPTFTADAVRICRENRKVGVVSGKLLGFNQQENIPTKLIDSTGLMRTWYGRWYDRGQREVDNNQYDKSEEMPALCGALLFCKRVALDSLKGSVFDEGFFLYKEDIDLSIRLRKKGWQLLYDPKLISYHCRGWNAERSRMPYQLRRIAAESEVLLYLRHPSPYIAWALFKYFLVVVFRI